MEKMPFVYDDGGRAKTGKRVGVGDCVVRAVSIASGAPYLDVHARISHGMAKQRRRSFEVRLGTKKRTNPDKGVNIKRKWFKDYMVELGFEWIPCMGLGTGCKVHLMPGELPDGRLVVRVSKHLTAVINGVIHDLYNPQRATSITDDHGTNISYRCVYGYWIKK